MLEVDDGNPATWGAYVSDDEYAAAPALERLALPPPLDS
jgi:hypothetical protein